MWTAESTLHSLGITNQLLIPLPSLNSGHVEMLEMLNQNTKPGESSMVM